MTNRNKILLGLAFLAIPMLPLQSHSAEVTTHNVKVEAISIYESGLIYIRTNPRPNGPGQPGFGCSDSFWLSISYGTNGYDAMLSGLLAAQHADKTVSVTANDIPSGTYCKLSRLITDP